MCDDGISFLTFAARQQLLIVVSGNHCQLNGMPIAMVSTLLGHQSINVTEKYMHHKDTDSLSEAVRKYGVTV